MYTHLEFYNIFGKELSNVAFDVVAGPAFAPAGQYIGFIAPGARDVVGGVVSERHELEVYRVLLQVLPLEQLRIREGHIGLIRSEDQAIGLVMPFLVVIIVGFLATSLLLLDVLEHLLSVLLVEELFSDDCERMIFLVYHPSIERLAIRNDDEIPYLLQPVCQVLFSIMYTVDEQHIKYQISCPL